MTAATRITVGEDYDVLVGRDLLAQVGGLVPPRAERALVVHPQTLGTYADLAQSALQDAGLEVHRAQVPDAESAKTIATAVDLWDRLGAAAFTRTDVLVAVGGGTVTDLVGFVAATWLRGVAVVQIPTTVLAMVDAAVGGKTGINTQAGKNLVGSFHPPHAVVCDLSTLETLPPDDVRAGLAEVVKGGFIADPRILELIESDPRACQDVRGPVLRELIERKIRVKARIVSEDLTEAWLRETLNYGHTLGHAIEQAEGYRLRHGEAISVGMVFAAELARAGGLIDAELVARHRTVLDSIGLPTADLWGSGVESRFAGLLEAMRRDKKSRGALLRFVVLDGLASVTRLEGPSEDLLRTAYRQVSTRP
ncbi:3-dehydroquinate synthase [Nostocoides sp. F2B08]|uniref:3-dehydroquinate synthase n=1 Tax=Nostocoides sp. F2B08 TaxID=2653936 RepID=UPI001263B3AC|nr:3-dehydroquinate synthase [Tetrasphaera sp. F2B08]KAB7744609.1 3-dehydroquinate synthase [Tetrasphaera sp. F2B08]